MQTYKETVFRYRVLRHEELPERHKAEYRLHGIDPDTTWSLIFSYRKLEDAEFCLTSLQECAPSFYTYKVVDAGADEVIERPVW